MVFNDVYKLYTNNDMYKLCKYLPLLPAPSLINERSDFFSLMLCCLRLPNTAKENH